MARKLWRISQILKISPFDPILLKHNEAQLDFILEMYSQDHPNELKFQRPGKIDPGLAESTAKAGWSDVLFGRALDEFLSDKIPNQQILTKLRGHSDSGNVVAMGPRSR